MFNILFVTEHSGYVSHQELNFPDAVDWAEARINDPFYNREGIVRVFIGNELEQHEYTVGKRRIPNGSAGRHVRFVLVEVRTKGVK
jgi:hypothetical protein